MNPRRIRFTFIAAAAVLLARCAAPIKDFYPDSFFTEDNTYQNRPLHFSLTFRGSWHITTDPNQLHGSTKKLAQTLQSQGGELLFVGTTSEGTQGVRGVAANLNLATLDYAALTRKVDGKIVEKDLGTSEILAGNTAMVRWDYVIKGYRFVEFFFTIDTYDIRIAFGAKPELFDRFVPEYLDIISSLAMISSF